MRPCTHTNAHAKHPHTRQGKVERFSHAERDTGESSEQEMLATTLKHCWLKDTQPANKWTHILCSFLLGLSPWTCLRGRYGEGCGRGIEDTSCVWSLYQWGMSSSKAVSNSMRIWRGTEREVAHEKNRAVGLLWRPFSTHDVWCLYFRGSWPLWFIRRRNLHTCEDI